MKVKIDTEKALTNITNTKANIIKQLEIEPDIFSLFSIELYLIGFEMYFRALIDLDIINRSMAENELIDFRKELYDLYKSMFGEEMGEIEDDN